MFQGMCAGAGGRKGGTLAPAPVQPVPGVTTVRCEESRNEEGRSYTFFISFYIWGST